MNDAIVVFNAGSTSLKFAAYTVDAARSLPMVWRRADRQHAGLSGKFVVKNAAGKPLDAHEWGDGHSIDHRTALQFVITWLEANLANIKVAAAGHRIVLGGRRFEVPVRIDDDVLNYLDSLVVVEPSHQPFNVRGARAFAEAFPGLPQVAASTRLSTGRCPKSVRFMRCPRMCAMLACVTGAITASPTTTRRQVPKFAPEARRVIAARLGGGASLCAMLDGRSIETTMGFRRPVGSADGNALGRPAAGRIVLPAAAQAL